MTEGLANPRSGILITDVRVSNFRSIRNIEVELGELTVLIGANNAGKTSFLDAFHAAIGSGRSAFGQDDIHLAQGEDAPPKERIVVIDIRIRPAGDDGKISSTFPEGSYWTSIWGPGIIQDIVDGSASEFVGLRTSLSWNLARGEYVQDRRFLKEWRTFADWLATPVHEMRVSAMQMENIALHYIDAKRDFEDDLRRAGSFWRRLTDDLGLPETQIAALEEELSNLNEQIVGGSEVLQHLKSNLADMQVVSFGDKTDINIAPVARRLRDLTKGVDVSFSTSSGQAFPIARHGMGTRSLASLLVFRAYALWKSNQASLRDVPIHSLLALEEPEAHLHPQAQRSLFLQIKTIPGQRIVSTHSPYLAGQARLQDLRLFLNAGGDSQVTQLVFPSDFPGDEIRAIEERVVESRGDLLFARGVVFFEGQTEGQALPIWAEKYWGATVHELGLSFVRVDGDNYTPFIWLAHNLKMPWYVLSDGEANVVAKLEASVQKILNKSLADCPNIFVLPNGNNFEKQLIAEGYLTEIEETFDRVCGAPSQLENYIRLHDGQKGRRQQVRNYSVAGGRELAALHLLEGEKTRMAKPIAIAISSLEDISRRFPTIIEQLFQFISVKHELIKKEG